MRLTFLPLINLRFSSEVKTSKITQNWESLLMHGAFQSLKNHLTQSLKAYQQNVVPATLRFSELSFRRRYYRYFRDHSHQSFIDYDRIEGLEKKALVRWKADFNRRNVCLRITKIVPQVNEQAFQAQFFLVGWRIRSQRISFDVAEALSHEYPSMSYDKAFRKLERSADLRLAIIMQQLFNHAIPNAPVQFWVKPLPKPVKKAPRSASSASSKASRRSILSVSSENSAKSSEAPVSHHSGEVHKVHNPGQRFTSSSDDPALNIPLNFLFDRLSSQISSQTTYDSDSDQIHPTGSSGPSLSTHSFSFSSSSSPSSYSTPSKSPSSTTFHYEQSADKELDGQISYLNNGESKSSSAQPKVSGDSSLEVVNSEGQMHYLTKSSQATHSDVTDSLAGLKVISGNDLSYFGSNGDDDLF